MYVGREEEKENEKNKERDVKRGVKLTYSAENRQFNNFIDVGFSSF